jgi:hypothetical protein
MKDAIRSAVITLATNDASNVRCLQTLRAEYHGQARDTVANLLRPIYASAVGIALSEAGAWPKDDPRTERAKRTFNNHIAEIIKAEDETPSAKKKAMRKLPALDRLYADAYQQLDWADFRKLGEMILAECTKHGH